jgi:hypothetical protein
MGRLQNNPSIRWVCPKSTHAHPLTWGNKNSNTGHFRPKLVPKLPSLQGTMVFTLWYLCQFCFCFLNMSYLFLWDDIYFFLVKKRTWFRKKKRITIFLFFKNGHNNTKTKKAFQNLEVYWANFSHIFWEIKARNWL